MNLATIRETIPKALSVSLLGLLNEYMRINVSSEHGDPIDSRG
jgi:hypothetical protein